MLTCFGYWPAMVPTGGLRASTVLWCTIYRQILFAVSKYSSGSIRSPGNTQRILMGKLVDDVSVLLAGTFGQYLFDRHRGKLFLVLVHKYSIFVLCFKTGISNSQRTKVPRVV
jgi:hypothetical protein